MHWTYGILNGATYGIVAESRIARFPAAGAEAVKDRVNAIALAPVEDFHRDSDLFGEPVRAPDAGVLPPNARTPGKG